MADKTVHITFGDDYRDHAVLLLAAAEELELDASVVATTDHGFSVPAKVAEKAGVKPDADEEDPEPEAPVSTDADSVEPTDAEPAAEPDKPARKTAAKKTTAPRKTAAKKAAATRTASKE